MNFDHAEKLFKSDDIHTLAADPDGLRFLKLRSLSRREYLEQLLELSNIKSTTSLVTQLFRQAYDARIDSALINNLIRTTYESERSARRTREPQLVHELYQLQAFNWGGLHQNSLEKTIVDNYVKKITSFDSLCQKIDNELHNSLRGYVLCSWYNHWTSIIIEDLFRDHRNVLPAIGQVKKIDFFLNDVPYDLKVTYLPEGFIADSRRSSQLRPELTLLKQAARSHSIVFDPDLPDGRLLEDLWLKARDHPSSQVQHLIQELFAFRLRSLETCQQDPRTLITWLYEKQGVRRFDASNRLFLVLVDRSNFFESWKLKRAKPLLDSRINTYLDNLGDRAGHEIKFTWENQTYTVFSDIVFAIHP
jgi:hypothetical protein